MLLVFAACELLGESTGVSCQILACLTLSNFSAISLLGYGEQAEKHTTDDADGAAKQYVANHAASGLMTK